MKKRNILLKFSYDGSNYAGWQFQENATAIQNIIQAKLSKICRENISITGCSRTDAGVHAREHVSNFRTFCTIPCDRLPLALNSILPSDIVCLSAELCPENFNARFNAVGKQYSYFFHIGPQPSAFFSRYSYHINLGLKKLDIKQMREAARVFLGEHDFSAFQASGFQTKTAVRRLDYLDLQIFDSLSFSNIASDNYHQLSSNYQDLALHDVFNTQTDLPSFLTSTEEKYLRLTIRGNGFLYNMVRIIAGTLLYVGIGKLKADDIGPIILSRNRNLAGKTAPACALFLDKVFYH